MVRWESHLPERDVHPPGRLHQNTSCRASSPAAHEMCIEQRKGAHSCKLFQWRVLFCRFTCWIRARNECLCTYRVLLLFQGTPLRGVFKEARLGVDDAAAKMRQRNLLWEEDRQKRFQEMMKKRKARFEDLDKSGSECRVLEGLGPVALLVVASLLLRLVYSRLPCP